jgi:hypothetical protein
MRVVSATSGDILTKLLDTISAVHISVVPQKVEFIVVVLVVADYVMESIVL